MFITSLIGPYAAGGGAGEGQKAPSLSGFLTDPEILELCDEIVATQERESAEMKELLGR